MFFFRARLHNIPVFMSTHTLMRAVFGSANRSCFHYVVTPIRPMDRASEAGFDVLGGVLVVSLSAGVVLLMRRSCRIGLLGVRQPAQTGAVSVRAVACVPAELCLAAENEPLAALYSREVFPAIAFLFLHFPYPLSDNPGEHSTRF